MGLLKVVENKQNMSNTMLYKLDFKKDFIARGSKLTVRQGEECIFTDKGRIADVFTPGFYTLDTNNIPILTKLMSWKYGFESPFKSDLFFVNTTQFEANWGTTSPITIRDPDFVMVDIRGFGNFTFRVVDSGVFIQQVTGSSGGVYTVDKIKERLKGDVIMGITSAIGQSKVPFIDMSANIAEFANIVKETISKNFKEKWGIEVPSFAVQNLSLPEEFKAMQVERAKFNMRRRNADMYAQERSFDVMDKAAANPGAGGTMGPMMGAGMGMGMGMGMGNMMGGMMGNMNTQPNQGGVQTVKCSCGAQMKPDAKFCPECGKAAGNLCPKCKAVVKADAKFCPECGQSLSAKCSKCKADLKAGAKFCPECGAAQ